MEKNIERFEAVRRITEKYKLCPYPAPTTARRGKPRLTVDFSALTDEEKLSRDKFYMACALELACEAARRGDVPVGAVVVRGGEIVAADFNGRESEKNALYHAECAAISSACEALGGWRLPGCELFVTLEPCIMCAGAVMNSRLPRVVFACPDPKGGFFGGRADARELTVSHNPEVTCGVLEAEASAMLSEFFSKKREGL